MTKKTFFVMVLSLILILPGCGAVERSEISEKESATEVPFVLRANPITGEKYDADLVKAFNKAYKDRYHLDVKWVMETEDVYRQNLKKRNVTGKLPVIMMDIRLQPAFFRRMAEDGRMMPLGARIDGDLTWRAAAGKEYPESFLGPENEVYLAPGGADRLSCVGIFYHKDKLKKAGWETFPETQEEYVRLLADLKARGVKALALHTEGTAWAAMLPATAELALSKEGDAFMRTFLPEKFNTPAGRRLAEILKRNFQYAGKDAFYADFDVAYNSFMSGDAAMIANGYWMIASIPEERQEEIGFAPFPGNILISSPESFGWAVAASATEEEKEGAMAFLKFRTLWEREKQEELFASGGRNSLERAYIKVAKNSPRIVPNYQINWDSRIQEKKIPEYLPLLAGGDMTPEEFVKALDQK